MMSIFNQPQFDQFKIEKVLYTDMWTQKNCNHFTIKHINFNKHKNAYTEITNSMQVLTIFTLYLVQQSVSIPPPESGLALSDQHLYSEGRLYHLHRVQALVTDEGKRNTVLLNIYLCCNPIFLKKYQSYRGIFCEKFILNFLIFTWTFNSGHPNCKL